MSNKFPDIRYKQIGKNLNVVIGDEKPITFIGDKDALAPIKENLKKYTEKKSATLLTTIREQLKPKTTAKVKEAEKEAIAKVGQEKLLKKELKETKLKGRKELNFERTRETQRKQLLDKLLTDKVLDTTSKGFALYGFPTVNMPELLVERFVDFLALGRTIEPLINFWMNCLLNPNPVARYKLFNYLNRHRLIVTPSGYFVTYRMVKETPTSKEDGIYVDAHTGQFQHIVGKVSKMDRSACDEDGKNDCSKGLHSGSPDFIGIKLGEGYDKGEIKTKSQGGGYGTGYGARQEVVTQKFDNSFGNQAVICIVSPEHVVSVPDSDTRKLRSCELYIAKLTTPEEVIAHLTEFDYSIFDSDYAQIKSDELRERLKEANLTDFTDGTVESQEPFIKTKTNTKVKIDTIEERLKDLRKKKITGDDVAKDLSNEEIMAIVSRRLRKVVDGEEVIEEAPKGIAEVLASQNVGDMKKVVEKSTKSPVGAKSTPTKGKAAAISNVVESVKDAKQPSSDKKPDTNKASTKAGNKGTGTATPIKEGKDKEAKSTDKAAGKAKIEKPVVVAEKAKPKNTKVVDLKAAQSSYLQGEFERLKKAKKGIKGFWLGISEDNDFVTLSETAKAKFKGKIIGNFADLK